VFLLIIVLATLHITIAFAFDKRYLVSPLNFVLMYIWVMVIRATELTLLGQDMYSELASPYLTEAVIFKASLAVALFLICFLGSYFISSLLYQDRPRQQNLVVCEQKVSSLLLLFMAAIGTMCAVQFYSQLTDLTDIILYRSDTSLFEGNGLLLSGISFLPAAVLGLLVSCRTKYCLIAVSAMLLLVASAVYAPLAQRGNVFTFIILGLSVWTAKFHKINYKSAVMAGVVILFCLEAAVIWRTAERYDTTMYEMLFGAYALGGIDRGEFDGLAALVAYDTSIGYESWWKFIVQLIPRSLMPSKEDYVAVSYVVNQEITGSADSGFTASVIGTFLAQGGYPLIAIGAFVFGLLVRRIQEISIAGPTTPNFVMVHGAGIAFVFFLARNGDLTNVIIMLVSNLCGVLFLIAALASRPLLLRTLGSPSNLVQ
jgi:hypothetical protein